MEDKLSASTTTYISANCSIRSLIPLSKTHIRCACLCAERCREIENGYREGNESKDKNDLFQEDIAYADGAIMSSVAFLESSINEFLQDYFYRFKYSEEEKSEFLINLKSEWDKNERGFFKKHKCDFIEGKYKFAYQIILCKELDEELNKENKEFYEAYTNFRYLIKLRNKLVHFVAKWQPDDIMDDLYEMAYFKDNFKENPFMEDTGNPYFPQKCLGAECAEWSIKTSIKFLTILSNDLSKSGIDLLKPHIIRIIQEYPFLETD